MANINLLAECPKCKHDIGNTLEDADPQTGEIACDNCGERFVLESSDLREVINRCEGFLSRRPR